MEIRREAFVKDWGAFTCFLRLAAHEAGGILNYTALSQEVGISVPTVKSYYQLLEDMFIGFTVPAYTRSHRKNLLSTPNQRSKDGFEIDYIIEQEGRLTPIEVKWTSHPSPGDAQHLVKFLNENTDKAARGYIICRADRPLAISDKVTALPWFCL